MGFLENLQGFINKAVPVDSLPGQKKKKPVTATPVPYVSPEAKAEAGFAMRDEINRRAAASTPAAVGAPTNTTTTPITAPKPPVAPPKPGAGPVIPPTTNLTPTPPAPTAPEAPKPLSDRDALVEKLTAAMGIKSAYDPVARKTALEAEAGVPGVRDTTTKLREERTKTLTFLDNLEKDIIGRTSNYLVSDAERRRIEASERAPITQELGILDRSLGTAETTLTEENKRIADQITAEQDKANRPLEDVKSEIEVRKTIDDLYGTDDSKLTSDMKEYEYSVKQGYTGSFLDYAREKANLKEAEPKKGTGYASTAGGTGATTPRDFKTVMSGSAGGKMPVADERKSLTKSFLVVDQIQSLASATEREATGPIWGIVRSANPYDTKAQQIKAQLTALVPNLARGVFGEVGVLTDQDVDLYSKTLPNLTSTEAVRNAVLGLTLKTVQRSLENQLEVLALSGIDVSGFSDKYDRLVKTIAEIEGKLGIKSDTAGGSAGGGASSSTAGGSVDLSDIDFSL